MVLLEINIGANICVICKGGVMPETWRLLLLFTIISACSALSYMRRDFQGDPMTTVFKYGDFVYFGTNSTPGFVYKYNRNTTFVEKMTLPTSNILSSVVVSNFVYLGTRNESSAIILKYDLTQNFSTWADSLSLTVGDKVITATTDGQSLYFGVLNSLNGTRSIVRVNISTFDLENTEPYLESGDLSSSILFENYIHFLSSDTHIISTYDKDSLAFKTSTNYSSYYISTMVATGSVLWMGGAGIVRRDSLPNLDFINNITVFGALFTTSFASESRVYFASDTGKIAHLSISNSSDYKFYPIPSFLYNSVKLTSSISLGNYAYLGTYGGDIFVLRLGVDCLNATGGLLVDGSKRLLYSSPTSCNATCAGDYIYCTSGILSGRTDYLYTNCSPSTNCSQCNSLSECPTPLTSATNATLNATNAVITMYFPASPNVSVSYSVANTSNVEYVDPTINAPGKFDGTSFFITFYNNNVTTHIPPEGTFLEISVENPTTAYLYYFDTETNEWTKNCADPDILSSSIIRVKLCHATQYAIFNIEINSSEAKSTDITAIAIVVAVLVVIISILTAAVIFYRRKNKKIKKSISQENIEMSQQYLLKDVVVKDRLGNGNFGEVFKGEWKGTIVALKKLKSASEYEEFAKESNMLAQFSHPNVVQFLGIFENEKQEKFIVTEFMHKGDLLSLLRNGDKVDQVSQIQMARQAAAGMVYLEDKNIVHRDLALRNFLVASSEGSKFTVKISDFGLSRSITDNYYQKEGSQLPVKWSAPESLKYGRFNSKSDVWSFGVCLWELFSNGETPYFTMSNSEAADKVNEGYRLPQPQDCPQEMYKLMLSCWKEDPNDRPSFVEILAVIENYHQKESPEAKIVEPHPQVEMEITIYN